MRKVIVFKVDGVLVKGYEAEKLDEMNGRKLIKKWLGEEIFEREFERKESGKKKVMESGEILKKLIELEGRFEEEGDIEKKYWIRDVRRKFEEWKKESERRFEEMRRKYLDEGYEKRLIRKREELIDLERICGIVGGRMIFYSEEKKGRVENLLYRNGLRRFEVIGDLESLKEEEKDIVVFEEVEDLKDMWNKIGLKRC